MRSALAYFARSVESDGVTATHARAGADGVALEP
jgi:hypothetical protein